MTGWRGRRRQGGGERAGSAAVRAGGAGDPGHAGADPHAAGDVRRQCRAAARALVPAEAAGGFLVLLTAVALARIAVLERAGWSGLVPRIGAASVGSFAVLLVAAPLLR